MGYLGWGPGGWLCCWNRLLCVIGIHRNYGYKWGNGECMHCDKKLWD